MEHRLGYLRAPACAAGTLPTVACVQSGPASVVSTSPTRYDSQKKRYAAEVVTVALGGTTVTETFAGMPDRVLQPGESVLVHVWRNHVVSMTAGGNAYDSDYLGSWIPLIALAGLAGIALVWFLASVVGGQPIVARRPRVIT